MLKSHLEKRISTNRQMSFAIPVTTQLKASAKKCITNFQIFSSILKLFKIS